MVRCHWGGLGFRLFSDLILTPVNQPNLLRLFHSRDAPAGNRYSCQRQAPHSAARTFAALQLHPHRSFKRSELRFLFIQHGTGTCLGVVDVSRCAIEFIEGHCFKVCDLSVVVALKRCLGITCDQVAFALVLFIPFATDCIA